MEASAESLSVNADRRRRLRLGLEMGLGLDSSVVVGLDFEFGSGKVGKFWWSVVCRRPLRFGDTMKRRICIGDSMDVLLIIDP